MLNNLKIRTKIFLSFLLVIIVSIGSIGITFALLNALDQKYGYIATTVDPAEFAAFDLRNSFTKDIRAIEEYGNGYADLEETQKIVTAEETNIDVDIKKIESLGFVLPETISSLRNILAADETADEAVFTQKKNEKTNAGQQLISPEIHAALTSFDNVNDVVNATIEKVITEIEQYKTGKEKELRDSINQGRIYAMVAVTSSLLVSFVLALLLSSSLSKSIKRIRDVAVKIREGDLTQRISTSSNDELGDLALVLNDMTAKVSERTAEVEAAKKQLEAVNAEIHSRMIETEKMNALMVDRENKMVELKKEVEDLKTHMPKSSV